MASQLNADLPSGAKVPQHTEEELGVEWERFKKLYQPGIDKVDAMRTTMLPLLPHVPELPSLSEPYTPHAFSGDDCPCCSESRVYPDVIRPFTLAYAANILDNFTTLNKFVECFETVIQRRWAKKSPSKRQGMLRAVWPRMAVTHRSDYTAFRNDTTAHGHNHVQKLEAYMWPDLNLQDLSANPEPLLLLLRSRGRNQPNIFIEFDYDSSRVGQCNGGPVKNVMIKDDIDGPGAGWRIIFRGAETPDNYGRLQVSWAEGDCKTDQHTFICRNGIPVETGILSLQIQQRTYSFLAEICKAIMHDKLSSLDDHAPVDKPPTYSRNTNLMSSLQAAAYEAPYRVPAHMDIPRMVAMLQAKLEAAEDHLHGLREDPSYFACTLMEWKEHTLEKPKAQGDQGEVDVESWAAIIKDCLGHALEYIDMWATLLSKTIDLRELEALWSSKLCRTSSLPKHYAQRFYALIRSLREYMMHSAKHLASGFRASGPMRSYYDREISRALSIKRRGKPTKSNKHTDPDRDELAGRFEEIVRWRQFNYVTMDIILDGLEKARIQSPARRELITSWVSDEMADLSVMAECWRQIMLYQPWATRFLDDLERIEKEESGLDAAPQTGDSSVSADKQSVPDLPSGLVRTAMPSGRRFYYPIEKSPNKQNNEAMRQAEMNLDEFWNEFLPMLRDSNLLNHHQSSTLLRKIARTPERTEFDMKTLPNQAKETDLDYYFGTLTLRHADDQPRRFVLTAEKNSKLKTKGTPVLPDRARTDESFLTSELESTTKTCRPYLKVDRRAAKAFQTLFYVPGLDNHQRELIWIEFTYAMTHVGFSAEKLYGSVWQFTPIENIEFTGTKRAIQFHEPHPHKSLPYWKARRLGR
ncbi:hypothetical protein BJ170DRAFT_724832 [Xylariales sp. AK1849]|nr:hypothetical protein BJ170DRAFT_724832 [Xylariales sp. AK1849]